MWYVAGGRAGIENRPSPSVTVVRCALVPTLVTVTVAPGMAAWDESVTCPTRPDDADCWAETAADIRNTDAHTMLTSFDFIGQPSPFAFHGRRHSHDRSGLIAGRLRR